MYVASSVPIDNTFGEEFGLNVRFHQGSVLGPMLFVMVMEALSLDCSMKTNTCR